MREKIKFDKAKELAFSPAIQIEDKEIYFIYQISVVRVKTKKIDQNGFANLNPIAYLLVEDENIFIESLDEKYDICLEENKDKIIEKFKSQEKKS